MPTANYDSSYRFTTYEQLCQDLKRTMEEKGLSSTALAPELLVTTSSLTRFLKSNDARLHPSTKKRIVTWLSGAIPPAQPSTPLAAWLTLQSCLLDVVGRTGELPPDALDAIFMLNKYFARAAQESNHD